MFTMILKISTILSVCLFFPMAYSLVDYSMPDESLERRLESKEQQRATTVRTAAPTSTSSARTSKNSGPTFLSILTKYDSLNVKDNASDTHGKMSVVSGEVRIQTPLNIFLTASYWQANTQDTEISQSSVYQKGNPKVVAGFNWFSFGDASNATKADIYGGASFAASNSLIGHSRNDKLLGIQTTKRFYDVALLIGGEFVSTGKVHNNDDMNIGNIMQFTAAIGWVVSRDIKFSLEGHTTKVASARQDVVGKKLRNDFSFASVTPSLILNIMPSIELELGANIQTKKAQLVRSEIEEQNLLDTKLLDYKGCYGNSIFAGLNFSV